jgi:serine protease Do
MRPMKGGAGVERGRGMSISGRKFLPAVVIVVTLGVGILIGTVVSHGVRAGKSSPVAPEATPLPPPSPAQLSNSFAQVAEALTPTVVNINAESTVRVARRRFHAPDDTPFGDFFDKFFQSPGAPLGELRQQNLGSGVILSPKGYILTNYHVVTQNDEDKPVDRINVSLHGDESTKYRAKIIGSDRWTDLAVIKIDADKPLTPASLGDSDAMRVGDWVLAIGSPFTLDSTVTAGIVSAKGRDIEGGPEGQFKRFIQTDAAINPGNSGGPLVNLAGQVIGINTAIATDNRRGTYDGVCFAIPSNTARKVYNALITSGSVQRGAIGVTFHSQTNPASLRMFGADHGVVIDDVKAGSPAERAGLKRGDVILSVDGKPVKNADELVAIVSDTEIGKHLRLEYLRWPDGKHLTTDVEVGDRNKIVAKLQESPRSQAGEAPAEGSPGALGVSVKSLTHEQAQELADQLHLDSQQGILVLDVQPGGFASDLGLQRGDIILSINHHTVRSAEDFNRMQSSLKSGQDVLLLIARGSGPRSYTTLFLADRLP